MFEIIRKHPKAMQLLLFAFIFPSFVLVGMEGYNRFRGEGEPVAYVDGREIRQGEWDNAHKAEIDRLRASMPTLDPKIMDSPQARYATLERMVRERVLAAAAFKAHIVVSDQRLARDLAENETIAALRRPDGTLDMDRYRQLVGSQGMTPEMFEARVRNDLSVRQVLNGVLGTGFAPNAVADISLGAYFERREVQVARFATAEYAAQIKLTDADLEQYHKDNPGQFQAPEQANIEYLVLDVDGLRKGITPNEEEMRKYHEQNAARLAGSEERRASHILINAPATASAADRQKAKARAEELQAQVAKAPDSFAEVARKFSQDPGSAPKGGDLDFFSRGAMVKPFEDAVFSMKKGEVSPVVESEFGYHVIRLTDIKAPKQRSFDEMRPEIEAELVKQMAQRKFSEVADAFTNGVYEQPDNLKGVADRLKLEVRTASNVTRNPAPGAKGVLANTKFLNALFSAESVEKKRNTEALETGANQLVSGRILQYTPARTLPLAEVKDRVRERLLAARGAELARKEGAARLAEWKTDASAAKLAEPVVVSRDQNQKLPPQVLDAALRADPAKLPALQGVDLGPLGYVVVRVNKVLPREQVDATTGRQDRAQYMQWWTAAEGQAYYEQLKERFKVEMKVPKPAPAAPGATSQG